MRRVAAGSSVRRTLLLLALCLLAVGGIRYKYLHILLMDREPLRRGFEEYPDPGTTQYPQFLEGVAKATRPGVRIAILVPMRRWDDGYSYAFYRASYFLAGREVLPLVWRDDRLLRENFDRAEYLAAWRVPFNDPRFERVASGRGGALFKRVRR